MWLVVVFSNVVLGVLCLLGAWQLWRLKQRFARAADTLVAFERSVHRVLSRAPTVINRGHSGIHQLRAAYQGLEPQWQRAQQALALLSLGQSLWRSRLLVLSQPPRSTHDPSIRKAAATRRSS